MAIAKAAGGANPPQQKKKPKSLPDQAVGLEAKPVAVPDILSPLSDPELVFGLVGPIGTDIRLVANILGEELSKVKYKCVHIQVTDSLKEIKNEFRLKESPTEVRYTSFMDAGNKLRSRTERQDALALFAVAAVRAEREKLIGSSLKPTPHTAFILNQLKRPEEVETLRRVYGRGFIQVSAYCSEKRRLNDLTTRISQSHFREKNSRSYIGLAQDLISRDDDEEENEFGQRVKNTFPLADVVINAENQDTIRKTCTRFVRSFFGDNFCTPSPEEYGMYMAKSAALRSSDLSRQVGAAIFDQDGEIVSLGCNEVPRAGGGAYWEGDIDDFRDFRVGQDSSSRVKREMVEDIFRRLRKASWLSRNKSKNKIEDLVNDALNGRHSSVLKDALLTNILEFGRVVHAEMAAITSAAKLGRALKGTTLYCTTFPCHICARHIVSSGIDKVIYIEPYSKSLAEELYPDSISVEGRRIQEGPKVEFNPFVGIAPQRYQEVFSKGKRKDSAGRAIIWDEGHAKPTLERLFPAYLQIEAVVIDALARILKDRGIKMRGSS